LFRTLEVNNRVFSEVNKFSKIDVNKTEKIVMNLLQYPLVVEEAATKRIPHRISQYISNLAASLHSYYNDEKIITEDSEETNEKLTVLKAVQIVLKDSLNLIGVSVKEKM
jgi:arginyl-tRNA synthetase